MLYLSRKVGEAIIINNSIELQVVEVRGRTVKLGFNFPPDASVLRKEIFDKIREENMAAAGGGDNDLADLLGAFGNKPASDKPDSESEDGG
jgi:carbon storage regulator